MDLIQPLFKLYLGSLDITILEESPAISNIVPGKELGQGAEGIVQKGNFYPSLQIQLFFFLSRFIFKFIKEVTWDLRWP
jgi:hypothetical protein